MAKTNGHKLIKHLRDLTPDPQNARKHGSRNVGLIETALGEVGAGRSIVIDETGAVLAGNATVEAAARAGIERVKVVDADGESIIAVRRSGLTARQKKRLALLDNAPNAPEANPEYWDDAVIAELAKNERELLDGIFRDNELNKLLAGQGGESVDAEPQLDRADELNKVWKVKTGDLFAVGQHRLLCGDSTKREDVDRVMGGEKVEMVWTDPPYGVAVGDKNKYLNSIARSNRVEDNLENDTLDEAGLIEMLCNAFDNAIAICTAGAAWYVAAPPGPLHVLFGQVLKERGIWRQTIQWVKNNSTFSPMGVCYHWQAEPIFFGWLPSGGHRYYGGRKQTTVWEIDRPTKSPEHPTMKPVELVARAVENSSKANEIVLDLFAGSGTTGIACENLKRRARMIELSPAYCAVILQRFQDAFGITGERVKPNGKARK